MNTSTDFTWMVCGSCDQSFWGYVIKAADALWWPGRIRLHFDAWATRCSHICEWNMITSVWCCWYKLHRLKGHLACHGGCFLLEQQMWVALSVNPWGLNLLLLVCPCGQVFLLQVLLLKLLLITWVTVPQLAQACTAVSAQFERGWNKSVSVIFHWTGPYLHYRKHVGIGACGPHEHLGLYELELRTVPS